MSHDSSRVPPPPRCAIRIINQSNERRPRQCTTTVARARTAMMRRDASPDASWRGAVAALVEDAAAFRRAVSFEQTANGNVGRALVRAPRVALDLRAACAYAVVMFTFNWFLRTVVVKPVASALMGFNDGAPTTKSRRARMEKFAQSALEAVTYGAFSFFGARIVPKQTWFWPSSSWWVGVPKKTLAVDGALRCYYLAYGARYVAGAVNVLLEHKRKDFWEMQLHHVATIIVIWVSYAHGWTRVGAVIMVVLDPADVPLHVAKCFKYVGDARRDTKFRSIADVFFGLFLVTFFIMRLVMYPYVVWSAHVEARRYFEPTVGYWTCVALLYIILGLQAYWFKLILNVAHRAIVTGNAEDVRSDEEDEDEARASPSPTAAASKKRV